MQDTGARVPAPCHRAVEILTLPDGSYPAPHTGESAAATPQVERSHMNTENTVTVYFDYR